jgi:NAD(P)-dependent dehydrogenase (short-subunit alcohol dehydrogenase family)
MDYELSGKTVVITGAAGAIGAALAQAFAAQGAKLVLLDRDHTRLMSLARNLPGSPLALRAELTDDGSVSAVVTQLSTRCEPIDVLINNAGTEFPTPLRAAAADFMARWDGLLTNNVGSMVRLIRAVVPLMRRGAVIINQSSVWGLKGVPEFSAYVASKHAVIGLTRSLAWELAAHGIRVNSVCPGWIQTEAALRSLQAMAEATSRTTDEVLEEILAGQVSQEFMRPEDLTGTFLFLSSEGSRAINGQSLVVSYGEVMN